MPELLLTGTWEQALLAASINVARKKAEEAGTFVGRTALQKVLYFLKRVGVPMDYRFDIYHYGPFCHDIVRDTDWLRADGVLVDDSRDTSRYSHYGPGPTAAELLSRHEESLRTYQGTIETVVNALIPLPPERMELVATLDYLHRSYRATGKKGSARDAVLARFLEVKKDRFPRHDVASTYDTMCAAGLLL